MFNLLLIETAQREREREIREAVRRRQLMAGGRSDPDLDPGVGAARAARRERQGQPARVVAP
jgi:hypothetical protein